jgi:hypothetical protein
MPFSYLLTLLIVVITASGITIAVGNAAGLLGVPAVALGLLVARVWVTRK